MADRPRKRKKIRNFWRACRYLWPYRAKIAVSLVAAFFVGFAMTGGLTTMIPIMRVMINGDTMQGWIYRRAVERRLGVVFVSEPTIVQVAQVVDASAKKAGIRPIDSITDVAVPP